MKKYLLSLLLLVSIIPSIALASWWNPFSWSIFHKKEVTPQVQVIHTETVKTSEEKINDLQKQLDDLRNQKTNSVSKPIITPKVKVIKTPAPVVDTPVIITPEIVKTDTSICDKNKDTLTKLNSVSNLIKQETSSIASDFIGAQSEENPTSGVQHYNYLYNKMSSESLGFYGKINQLQIDTAGLDNILNGVDLIEIKSNLNNGGNTFKQAFDLIMQANKYVSESVSNVAIIDNALATLKDGYKKQNSALAYFYLATSKMETLKKVLSDKIENEGCLK